MTTPPNIPQLENGFIRIATGKSDNDIVRALLRARLTGGEWDVVMTIIRKTWGFSKQWDKISLSQFASEGKRTRRAYIVSISSLLVKRIALVKRGALGTNQYSINKRFNEWLSEADFPSEKKRKKLVKQTSHTKETVQKKPILKIKFQNFFKQFMPIVAAAKEFDTFRNRYGEEVIERALNHSSCTSQGKFIELCEYFKKTP